ncbi:MAG: cysteine methyltransferase, partial [Pseudomonas fluorescens]
ENRITNLKWGEAPATASVVTQHPAFAPLESYFKGKTPFDTSISQHLALQGTPFQQRVWQALLEIPQGQTMTYGQLATQLGTSPRALGGAVGANPIPVIIPCHRVMGQNGKLTGFSAPGGVITKQWLLNHEGITC